MARARFSVYDGITVSELKAILADCPEVDDEGNDAFVFILAGNSHVSILNEVFIDDEGDLIAVPESHGELMRDLGTYADFFGLEEDEELAAEESGELEPVGLN